MSVFGHWIMKDGMPAFALSAQRSAAAGEDHNPVVQNRLMVGNQRIQLCVTDDGGVGLYDEAHGQRWITDPAPAGTGLSILEEDGRAAWGTGRQVWPHASSPEITIGATSTAVTIRHDGIIIERTMICPCGEQPWVLIRVAVTNVDSDARSLTLREQWDLRPRYLNLGSSPDRRARESRAAVLFDTARTSGGVRAQERRTPAADTFTADSNTSGLGSVDTPFAQYFGPTLPIVLERLDAEPTETLSDSSTEPRLELHSRVRLAPGTTQVLWFRFGIDDDTTVEDPESVFVTAVSDLAADRIVVTTQRGEAAQRELAWHRAILVGSLCTDAVIGGHTLNQGSSYSFVSGMNAAARDPLQHALPLVYTDPAMALSVLRNTMAWATPDGDLPFAIDGAKVPLFELMQPSDQNLYVFWLAAEYAAATGDLAAFDEVLAYHPVHEAVAVTVREHLRRQQRYILDVIGRGKSGHLRIRNADWNDMAIHDSGVAREVMITDGESVLNSAMAAYILPLMAGLWDRLGEVDLARECNRVAADLRDAVRRAWNGSWFDRAYAPGGHVIGGAGDLWLEVQPWAILCGAASAHQTRTLLSKIAAGPSADSPLGARVRWPVPQGSSAMGERGEGTGGGGIWFSINVTLLWALRDVDADAAWNEWSSMLLENHTSHYPDLWEGTLSGPDAYNAPESPRPGQTWRNPTTGRGMQTFPVNNLHSHAQPLLGYLRLLGVEPTPDGHLRVTGGDGTWRSALMHIDEDGHGSINALGKVILDTPRGIVEGGPGLVEW